MKNTGFIRTIRKTPHLARKKRRRKLARIVSFFLVVMSALFGLALYGLYRPAVSISRVQISGTEVLNPGEIEKVVLEELGGKYWRIFPKKSTFFYPKTDLMGKLKKDFKRIDKIDIKRDGFTGIAISLSERPEHYLWCGRDFVQNRTHLDDCYFADSGGYIFSKAPYYSGDIFLEFYGPLTLGSNSSPISGTILPEDEFGKLMLFRAGLTEMNFVPTKILLNLDGDYEIYFSGGGKILATGKNDLSKNIEYLKLAIATDPLKTKIETSRADLDYLDLRFGNKVFYRFK